MSSASNEDNFSTGGGTMTIEERHAHWREVLETQKTSGLSIADYCRSRDILRIPAQAATRFRFKSPPNSD